MPQTTCYTVDMKFIVLSRGFRTLVDDEDYDRLMKYKWWVSKRGNIYYAVGYPRGQWTRNNLLMHRIILNASEDVLVDHKNRNGLNNQKSNLRICTKSQNIQNSGLRHDNTSGYKGVGRWKGRNKYLAYLNIRVNKNKTKRIDVGYYNTAIEAAKARDAAARKYHGEFAYQNFPQKEVA